MGREHFTAFQSTQYILSMLTPHTTGEERAPQLLRPHQLPKHKADLSGCYPCCNSLL